MELKPEILENASCNLSSKTNLGWKTKKEFNVIYYKIPPEQEENFRSKIKGNVDFDFLFGPCKEFGMKPSKKVYAVFYKPLEIISMSNNIFLYPIVPKEILQRAANVLSESSKLQWVVELDTIVLKKPSTKKISEEKEIFNKLNIPYIFPVFMTKNNGFRQVIIKITNPLEIIELSKISSFILNVDNKPSPISRISHPELLNISKLAALAKASENLEEYNKIRNYITQEEADRYEKSKESFYEMYSQAFCNTVCEYIKWDLSTAKIVAHTLYNRGDDNSNDTNLIEKYINIISRALSINSNINLIPQQQKTGVKYCIGRKICCFIDDETQETSFIHLSKNGLQIYLRDFKIYRKLSIKLVHYGYDIKCETKQIIFENQSFSSRITIKKLKDVDRFLLNVLCVKKEDYEDLYKVFKLKR